MPNIDKSLYARFKKEGYRIKQYRELPVPSIPEVVHLAYLDVCRTIKGIKKDQSCSFKKTVALSIVRLLSSPPMNQPEFDQLHHKCCQLCLTSSSASGTRIHYGQAQKLLNMSLKYIYNEFAFYYGKMNQFCFPDNNAEFFYHLPIDNQILDCLVGQHRFAAPRSTPWSKWTYDHYIHFQSQLRDRISRNYKPLEIDYMIWHTKGACVGDAISINR